MKYNGNKAENVKIAYIGGGSRDWARSLMSDLAVNPDMSGDVYLYDLDYTAAKDNETIGNKFNSIEYTNSRWSYHAAATEEEAYTGADFVVISILPGSFDDMASDVHTPERYGIYQSVGDTTGPGGILRAMRTVPMFEHIARCVEDETMKTLDVGGDDRGAFALGRLSRAITEKGDYEMLMVINCARPLTRDAESTIEVMREIEAACRIPFTGIVNNTNLGRETTAETVLNSLSYAEEVSRLSGLPVVMTTVRADVADELEDKVENLFPLTLQNNMI